MIQTSFIRLGDALRAAMENKRNNPGDIIFIHPEDTDLSREWNENGWWISTCFDYTNLPLIGYANYEIDYDEDPETCLNMVADEEKYIASVIQRICQEFGVEDTTEDWDLNFLNDNYGIYLFIKPQQWDEVKRLVETYNHRVTSQGFKPLVLDENFKMVKGTFDGKYVSGGFFEKRKIRKQNKEHVKSLNEFLMILHPYMRRI